MIHNLSYLLNNVNSLKTGAFFVLLAVLSPIPGTSSEAKITVEFLREVNGFLGNGFQTIQTMDHFTKWNTALNCSIWMWYNLNQFS